MNRIIWITGQSGVGKTTVGDRVASMLGYRFIECDDFKRCLLRGGLARADAGRFAYQEMIALARQEAVCNKSVVISAPISLPETLEDIRSLRAVSLLYIVELLADTDELDRRIEERSRTLLPGVIAIRTATERIESYTATRNLLPIREAISIDTSHQSVEEVSNLIVAKLRPDMPQNIPANSNTDAHICRANDLMFKPDARPVVFASGVFDLFHAGHLHYLTAASRLGKTLIVHVGSDSEVSKRKGSGRPIQRFEDRIAIVAHCRFVDTAIEYTGHTLACAQLIKPDIIAVTVEVRDEFISLAPTYGFCTQDLHFVRRDERYASTTDIINRLKRRE